MPTPSVLVLLPHLWTAVAVLLLGLLGIVVGRFTGRLVPLFGPVHPPRVPDPPDAAEAHRERSSTTGRRDVAVPVDPPEGVIRGTPYSDFDEDEGPPPPRCPHCRAELPFVRVVPFVASRYFCRRGACPHCERAIRPDLAVVVTTAVLFALVGALDPLRPPSLPVFSFADLAVLWLAAVGVPLAVIDIRVMRLPNAVVVPAYPVAALLIAAAVVLTPSGPTLDSGADAVAGMVLITVLHWLLWRVYPKGLGYGDVKLSGLMGLYAGWAAGPFGALAAVFWAFAAFSLVGLVLMALRRITRREPFPLGPFMLAATLATVLAGVPLVPQP